MVFLTIFNSLTLAESAIIFSGFVYRTATFIGMSLLIAILLQMFQNKIKISAKLFPVNHTEHLQISKKMCFVMVNVLVTIIQKTRAVFDSAKCIVLMRI